MRAALLPPAVVATLLGLLTGCTDGEEPAADAPPAATRTTPAPATTPLSGPDAVADDWPAEAPLEQGAEQWAVYLAVEDTSAGVAPESVTRALDHLGSLGYTAVPTQLGCDMGAPEALGRDPDDTAVAVYFQQRADAGDFTALHKDSGLGFVDMVRVTRYCLD